MDWMKQLSEQVREALASGEARTITVDSEAKAELGRTAAERLARRDGADASRLTFQVADR